MKRILPALLDFLFPPLCHICRSFIADAGPLHICPACRELLPLVMSPRCTVCGVPFAGAGSDHICGRCLKDPPCFDAACSQLLYEGAARDLLHRFKYQYKTHLRRPLALLALEGLTEIIQRQQPDMIVPVPLHRSRLRSRGFNQAVLLGSVFSTRLKLPMLVDGLARIRWTEPQIELSADQRRSNVKGAFACTRPDSIAGKRILLLDDVMTTGSTVDECAKELKKAGASFVLAATVARAAR